MERQISKAKKNGRDVSWDTAYEEVVADSMEAMLNDGNVVLVISELKQRDKTLWQKICDWFKNLAEDLKAVVDAYKGHKPDSVEGKMVAAMQDVIVILESLYADALVDASENYQRAEKNTTPEGGVKYQARPSKKDPSVLDPRTVTKTDVAQMLENVKAGNYPERTYIPVRISTPGIVQERLFAKDLPIIMPVSKIAQALAEDHGPTKGKNVRGHGLSVDDLIAIIERMDSPDFVYSQTDGRGVEVIKLGDGADSTVVIVEFDNNINSSHMNGYEGGTYNVSVTMFDVDGGNVGLFMYSQDKGWHEVFNKQKEGDPAKKFPATRPFTIEQDSLNDNVSHAKPEVNKKFSTRDEVCTSALEYFGQTWRWAETGYLLTNGDRLDFSGRHEGASGGYRTVDHRDILDVYPEDADLDGNSAMVDFMRRGNIRIMPEGDGINLQVAPTKAQESGLDDFISRARGEVTLDIDDENGNTVVSVEYLLSPLDLVLLVGYSPVYSETDDPANYLKLGICEQSAAASFEQLFPAAIPRSAVSWDSAWYPPDKFPETTKYYYKHEHSADPYFDLCAEWTLPQEEYAAEKQRIQTLYANKPAQQVQWGTWVCCNYSADLLEEANTLDSYYYIIFAYNDTTSTVRYIAAQSVDWGDSIDPYFLSLEW